MLFLFFGSSAQELYAQSLVIRLNNGSETTDLLNSLQKLSFAEGNLLVSFKSGSTESYQLPEIQKLYFGFVESVPEPALQAITALSIYPNPAGQEINLQNIPVGTSTIFIYRMDGKLMMQAMVSSSSETIKVDDLQSGIYILIANNQTVKFIKL